MPCERVVNARCQAFTYSFFFAPGAYLWRLGITEGYPDLYRFLAFLSYLVRPSWVHLRKMKPGVDKNVHALPGGFEKGQP